MSQDTYTGSDKIGDVLLTKIQGDITELFTAVAAATSGSGVKVSATDSVLGTLITKLLAGSSNVTLTLGDEGGNETLSIFVDADLVNDTSPELGGDLTMGAYKIPGLLGAETIFIPAAAMKPRKTNGATSGSVESSTNKVMMETLDFDATADEFAQFQIRMPKSWDAGTVTAQFIWSHPATTTNFGVRFYIQGLSLTDGDAVDTAFGTAIGHTADTGGTTDDIYITPMTDAITISNTPAKSDYVIFQVYRDVSDPGDALAVDARLHGVALIYNTDAHTDA